MLAKTILLLFALHVCNQAPTAGQEKTTCAEVVTLLENVVSLGDDCRLALVVDGILEEYKDDCGSKRMSAFNKQLLHALALYAKRESCLNEEFVCEEAMDAENTTIPFIYPELEWNKFYDIIEKDKQCIGFYDAIQSAPKDGPIGCKPLMKSCNKCIEEKIETKVSKINNNNADIEVICKEENKNEDIIKGDIEML